MSNPSDVSAIDIMSIFVIYMKGEGDAPQKSP